MTPADDLPPLPDGEAWFHSHPLIGWGMQQYALAACSERDAEIERLRGCVTSIKAMGDEIARSKDERIKELEARLAPQKYEFVNEDTDLAVAGGQRDALRANWADLQQRAEATEARVKELERQIAILCGLSIQAPTSAP